MRSCPTSQPLQEPALVGPQLVEDCRRETSGARVFLVHEHHARTGVSRSRPSCGLLMAICHRTDRFSPCLHHEVGCRVKEFQKAVGAYADWTSGMQAANLHLQRDRPALTLGYISRRTRIHPNLLLREGPLLFSFRFCFVAMFCQIIDDRRPRVRSSWEEASICLFDMLKSDGQMIDPN